MAKKQKDEEGNISFMECENVTFTLCHYEYLPPLPVDLDAFYKCNNYSEDMYNVISYLRSAYAEGYTTEFFKDMPIEDVYETLTAGKPKNKQRMIRRFIRVYREFLNGVYEV